MDKNERVAKALGIEYEVVDYGGGVTKLRDPTFHTPLLDYEHDIAAAMTLVPLFGRSVVMEYHAWGIPEPYWSVEYDPGESMECAATLSAAIVDAFLAAKGE